MALDTCGRTPCGDSVVLRTMDGFRRHVAKYADGHGGTARLCVVCLDVENFREYVRCDGLGAGDALMQLVIREASRSFVDSALFRPVGGRVLVACLDEGVEVGVDVIRKVVRGIGHEAGLDLKTGVASLDESASDVDDACERARMACESMLHVYGRYLRRFDDDLGRDLERRRYVESHVERAVEQGWVTAYFQPIVRTMTGHVCEFEALARWEDPVYGMISPAVFVEALESSRLVNLLDAHVVREACRTWRGLVDDEGMVVPMSVNLSRLDFALCDVLDMVESAVSEYGVPREMLHLEITESAIDESADELVDEVKSLRDAGYQVWLDDFGSGYSSLNTLKDYSFDVVKIDMAFLREFDTRPKSRIIIASIVSMAKQLGMHTLIEGVESEAQYEFLREIGCEFVQGYLVGRPMRMSDNIGRVRAGELDVGEPVLHGYYDRLGAVNTLSAMPFDFPWDVGMSAGRPVIDTVPVAIVERTPAGMRVLSANDSFLRTVERLPLGGLDAIMSRINDETRQQARVVREATVASVASGRVETVDVMSEGVHVAIRIRHIASHDDVDAVLVSFVDLAGFVGSDSEGLVYAAKDFLCAVYDEVAVIDVGCDDVITLYRGDTVLPAIFGDGGFAECAMRFAAGYVHASDRERFLSYMDLSDLDHRIELCSGRFFMDAFRVMVAGGTYAWAAVLLASVFVGGRRLVVACVHRIDEGIVSMVDEGDEVPKSVLWDTLIDLAPVGVFWKDRDRRFLGANGRFLDFYGFDSVDDIIGRNDEDMGWHVDTGPFMRDEIRVIKSGGEVRDVRGTCISRGEVHEILASKVALRRGGEIVGLLGYFSDAGTGTVEAADELTGLPSVRGLAPSIGRYRDAYEAGGPDFAFVVVQAHDTGGSGDAYGRSFSDRVTRYVAAALLRAVGVEGVVARIEGDGFLVVSQVGLGPDDPCVSDRLRRKVEAVGEVDGLPVAISCSVGSCLWSEGGGIDACMAIASGRIGVVDAA